MYKTMLITAEDIRREIRKSGRVRRVRSFSSEDHCGNLNLGRLKTRYRFRRYKPFKRVAVVGNLRKGKARFVHPGTFAGAWRRTKDMGTRRLARESLATPARLAYRARKNPLTWIGGGAAGYLYHNARRGRRLVEDHEAGLKGVYDPRKQREKANLGGDKMVTIFIRGRPVEIPAWKYHADMDVGFKPGLGRYDD